MNDMKRVANGSDGLHRNRIMATWLFGVAAMVFLMIVLGGVTRLTDSGLSMVEWRPLTGWLPPFSDAEWKILFEKYQAYPEFHKMNAHMKVDDFKGIFWLEFLHRLWGRAIGVVFLLPFVVFLIKGWVDRPLAWQFVIMFVVGGLQGVLGWYMVKSGLIDRPDVSQYRLAAHLCLALIIFAYILWVAITLWRGDDFDSAAKSISNWAAGLVGLIFVTAFSGALVAGLDAGLTYNTFPLMDGDLVPDGMFTMSPAYINLFENITTVQFDHRLLAMTTFAAIVIFWHYARRVGVGEGQRRALNLLLLMACLQVALGISTLLLVVPVPLAAAHQAGAVVLLGLAVWVLRESVSGAK